jgi:uncharacterized protein (DUF1501 family)
VCGLLPVRPSLAGSRDPRFLLVVLRGGLDGLAAVMPVGDPGLECHRRDFVADIAEAGEAARLDDLFALHPALPTLTRLYRRRQALIVHATATPYRGRSHFDGQEVLESGYERPMQADSGWLNRALALIEARETVAPSAELGAALLSRGLAVGPTVPLVMQGPAPILSWAPQALPRASDDTVSRLLALYEARDPVLAEALSQSVALERATGGMAVANQLPGEQAMLAMAEGAARLLVRPDGPRIGTLSIDGWDTHAGEGPGTGRLGRMLGALDRVIATLETGLEPVWQDTVVAIVTEFGRAVRMNGTAGTDHGTATAAVFVGGAVKGGRVLADWPGLADRALYQSRDLMPTTDLRSVFASVLTEHLGLEARQVARTVFPGSARLARLDQLFA